METHDIDSIIKKIFNESADYYDVDANNSKEKIWKHIQWQKQNQPKRILLRSLVAVCILLFICTSVITISNIKAKKTIKTLVELNNALKNQTKAIDQNTLNQKEPFNETNIDIPDTVYIEKRVLVSKPAIKTKQIVDTVYIREKVYIEKEQDRKILTTIDYSYPTDTISQLIANNYYETEIHIRNNESVNRKKEKKLQIKFGGNKNQANSGTLSLKTEL